MTEPGTEVEEELDDAPLLRWYVIAAFVAGVVAGFAVAGLLSAFWFAECADVGGKRLDVAGDSPRAELCRSAGGAAGLSVPVGWLIGLVLATLALLRWEGRRWLLSLLFLAPVLLPVAAYAGLASSSLTCAGDELAAYREWVDDGARGQPPHDCRTF